MEKNNNMNSDQKVQKDNNNTAFSEKTGKISGDSKKSPDIGIDKELINKKTNKEKVIKEPSGKPIFKKIISLFKAAIFLLFVVLISGNSYYLYKMYNNYSEINNNIKKISLRSKGLKSKLKLIDTRLNTFQNDVTNINLNNNAIIKKISRNASKMENEIILLSEKVKENSNLVIIQKTQDHDSSFEYEEDSFSEVEPDHEEAIISCIEPENYIEQEIDTGTDKILVEVSEIIYDNPEERKNINNQTSVQKLKDQKKEVNFNEILFGFFEYAIDKIYIRIKTVFDSIVNSILNFTRT